MMDLCGICDKYYNNSLNDDPPFSCIICKQGCHSPCFQEMKTIFEDQPVKIGQAFNFVCTSCLSDFDNDPSMAPKPKLSPSKQVTAGTVDQEEEEESLTLEHDGIITLGDYFSDFFLTRLKIWIFEDFFGADYDRLIYFDL